MIDRTKQTADKAARSKTSNNPTARPSRMALAVSMALMAPAAVQVAYAGPGKVCLDGTTAPVTNPVTALTACADGSTPIGTYYANSPPLRKFVDTLANLTSAGANTFANSAKIPNGEYISIAEPDTASYPGSEYFVIGVVEHDQWMHSDLQKATTQRSYVQLYPSKADGGKYNATSGLPIVPTSAYGVPIPTTPVALYYPDSKDSTGNVITQGKPITWPDGSQVYGYDKAHYLGPIIITMKGTPVRIKFVNFLPNGAATTHTTLSNGVMTKQVLARNGDMFLPTDESLGGAGLSPDTLAPVPATSMVLGTSYVITSLGTTGGAQTDFTAVGATTNTVGISFTATGPGAGSGTASPTIRYPQNRVAFHLHGGDSPWISDGTPHQWVTAAGENTLYKRGDRVMDAPDMPYPGDGGLNTFWPNDQSNRLMWYHDHTFGLTRQNAYAGAAAGYVIIDQAELDLLSGTHGIQKVIPGGLLDQLVLVVQDKGFVPNDIAVQDSKWDQNAWGKPGDLWFPHVYEPAKVWDKDNPAFFGAAPGQVFDPLDPATTAAQKIPSFDNPAGRWDYAVDDATGGYRVPNAQLRKDPDYGNVGFPDGTYSGGPSSTPESYMDTPLVNGIAYPTMTVEPKAYRVRFLNGANDRYWNLSLWVAADKTTIKITDPTASSKTALCSDNSVIAPANCTEVKMVPADGTSDVFTLADGSTVAPADGRPGGVPDPAAAGPAIIRFGNEGGLLQQPVVHKPKPMTGAPDSTGAFILARDNTGGDFYLGGAERADTIIDFSQYAGQTLIMYNDSSAPVPGGDDRYDYYTGDPDQRPFGGAPTTVPGYGPNTRTVMQIVVGNSVSKAPDYPLTSTGEYNVDVLKTELQKAYNASADAHIVADGTLPTAFDAANATMTLPGVSNPVPLKVKTIRGLTDPNFGRLIAQLGYEIPIPNADPKGNPLSYVDEPTDIIGEGETQYWWIKNNDVDNHPMHFHLFNVQVVARIDQTKISAAGIDAAAILRPQSDETGWKETVKNWPLEDVIVAIKPKTPALPFGLPKSVRNLDPTLPLNASTSSFNRPGLDLKSNFFQYDVNDASTTYGQTKSTVNTQYDFDWEYVWHCHILGHEENDLMRPLVFHPAPPTVPGTDHGVPRGITPTVSGVGVNTTGKVTWTDPTPPDSLDANNQFIPSVTGGVLTKGNTDNEIGFRVERAVVTTDTGTPTPGTFTALAPNSRVVDGRVNTLANATSFQDAPAKFTDYAYQVVSVNEGGTVTSNPTILAQAPAAPVIGTVSAAGLLTWTDKSSNETGFQVWSAPVTTDTNGTPAAGAFTMATSMPANATSATFSLAPNSDYQYYVVAVNESVPPTISSVASATVSSPATAPAAPTNVQVSVAGAISWIDNAHNETSYKIERAPLTTNATTGVVSVSVSGFSTIGTPAANTIGFQDPSALVANTDYRYQVSAINAAGASAYGSFDLSAVPAAASGIQIGTSGTSAVVNWTNNATNQTGFTVYRATVANGTVGSFAPLNATTPVAGTSTSYTDSTIVANTDYQYYVVTLNGTKVAANSAVGTLFQAPKAATGLVVAATPAPTARTLTLNWADNSSNEDGFSVEASADGGITWASLPATPVAANVVTFAATTLLPATVYQFRVAATKATVAGYTPVYTTTSYTTPVELLAPVVTVLSSLVNGAPQAKVTWTDTSTGETGYAVERCAGTTAQCALATANWVTLPNTPMAANSTSYIDTTLATGATYVYRVKALNGATLGPVGTSAQVATAIAVATPSNLTASSSTGVGVTLVWTDNSTNETSFQVWRAPAGSTAFVLLGSVTRTTALKAATGGTVTYADATALAGTGYDYQVIAVNTTGTTVSSSLPSNTANITLAMPAPTGLTATQSGANIVVKWTDTSATETSFEVVRTDVAAEAAALTALQTYVPTTFVVARTAAQATSVNTVVTYNDVAATPGTVYTYAVRAVNTPIAPAVGATTYSAFTATVTASVVIPAPTGLTTALPVAPATGVILNWVDNATFETAYQINRAIIADPGFGGSVPATTVFTLLAKVARTGNVVATTGAVSYTDPLTATPLAVAGQVYAYQVVALNGTAASAPSNAAHSNAAVAVAGAPTGLTAVTSSGTSIVLSWIDNSTNETAFQVTRTDVAAAAAAVAAGTAYVPTTFATPARSTALKTAVGGTVSYTDATAALGTTYTYTVAAVTSAAGAAVTTGPSSTPVTTSLTLNAPTSATVAATATGITVGWTDASNNETGFKIVRNVAALDSTGAPILTNGLPTIATGSVALTVAVTSTTAQRTAAGTVRTYIDTTALPGVTYFYTVAATAGTVAAPVTSTAAYTVPTSVIAPALNPPSIPTAAITNATRITVSWTDLSNNETGFLVERLFTPAVLPAGWTSAVWTPLPVPATAGAPAPTVTVTRTAAQKTGVNTGVSYADNLVAATAQGTYQYRVSAVNTSGVAPAPTVNVYSAPATMPTPLDFTVPAAPTALTATTTPGVLGVVNLSWTDMASNETGFTVQRATNATFTAGLVSTAVPGAITGTNGLVNYTLNGLTSATKYYFRVAATNTAGTSTYATFGTVNATTNVVTPTLVTVP